MAEQNSSGEIDISLAMINMRLVYHKFLIWVYQVVRFFLTKWLVIFGIIFFGVLFAYFLKKVEPSKETTLIVQVNFGTVDYLYDAIDQLKDKIIEGDIDVLTEIGLYQGGATITKIEVEPIVDIMEIIQSNNMDNNNLELLIKGSKHSKDPLASELFTLKYKLHKIKMKTNVNADETIIPVLLDYLNGNPLLNEIRIIMIEEVQKQIIHNEQSIGYIDSILKSYSVRPLASEASSQMYFNNTEMNNNNVHLLLKEKSNIIVQNKNLIISSLRYDNVVQLMNEPMLQVKKGALYTKVFVLPLLFLLLFVLWSILTYYYNKAKKLSLSVKNGKDDEFS